jgi:hypothetical protein
VSVEPEIPPARPDDVDVDQLEYLQTLTPLQRVLLHEGARELVVRLREAGRRLYGDADSRPAEAPR